MSLILPEGIDIHIAHRGARRETTIIAVYEYKDAHPNNATTVCPMCGGDPDAQPIHSDSQVLALIALLLEDDVTATVAILLKTCRGHTLQSIADILQKPRPSTRQAVQLRMKKLADQYPAIERLLTPKESNRNEIEQRNKWHDNGIKRSSQPRNL